MSRRTRAQQLPSSIDFLALPLLVKQIVVAMLPLRDALAVERVSKHCATLIDWRDLARRAVALVNDSEFDDDDLLALSGRFVAMCGPRGTIDQQCRALLDSAHVTRALRDFVLQHHASEPRLTACVAFRLAACLSCDAPCARFWFGHRLCDTCERKHRDTHRMVALNEARSAARAKHRFSADEIAQIEDSLPWTFKMSTGSTSKLAVVWVRQWELAIERHLARASVATTATSPAAQSSSSPKKRRRTGK